MWPLYAKRYEVSTQLPVFYVLALVRNVVWVLRLRGKERCLWGPLHPLVVNRRVFPSCSRVGEGCRRHRTGIRSVQIWFVLGRSGVVFVGAVASSCHGTDDVSTVIARQRGAAKYTSQEFVM